MNTRLKHVWRHLRSERGDGDPVLTIVSMIVSAAIASTIIGTIILIITLGANYVAENVTATNLASARKSWSLDANNASFIDVLSNTEITFVELPHQAPGVYMQRPGKEGDVCRVSTWTIDGDQLTNRVEKYDPADCDADGSITGQPVDVLPLYTFSGIAPGTTIETWNTAGRDLYFDADGTEIGLAENSPAPSTAERKSWWRDYEWESSAVRRVNIVGEIAMPLSGDSPTAIVGSSWITTSNAGDELDSPEPEPETTQYDPNFDINDVHVTRSSTVGKVVAFVREGIDIDLSSTNADCGPYSVEWTVRWLPANPDAPMKTTTFTSFGPPAQPVSFDEVYNGLAGEVEVTAACPDSVSDNPMTKSKPYTQGLPNPVLDGDIPDRAQPHQHALTWTQTSTLPLEYNLIVAIDGQDPIPATDPETVPDLGANPVYDLGSTYGRSYLYTVTATLVGGATSNPSNDVLLYEPWPDVPEPTVTVDDLTDQVAEIGVEEPLVCPAGTHAEYRARVIIDRGGAQAWTDWQFTPDFTYALEEGRLYEWVLEQRCATTPDHASDPGEGSSGEHPAPIITEITPDPGTPTTGGDEDAPSTIPWTAIGTCPAPYTWAEYRFRYAIDEDPVSGATWGPWGTDNFAQVDVVYGHKVTFEIEARCSSDWTDGPDNGGDDDWVRPIPAPPSAAPVLTHDAGGASAWKDDRILWTPIDCWEGTEPRYEAVQSNRNGAYGDQTGLNRQLNTRPGEAFIFTVQARCWTVYDNNGVRITSNQTNWTTPIAAPTPPTVYTTGTRRAGSGHNVYGQGSTCEPGTLGVIYQVRVEASGWQGQGYRTYQPQGNRTYQARAACDGIDIDSGWTEGSNSIFYVDAPLPPAAPSGVGASGNMAINSDLSGWIGRVVWNEVDGATSYEVQAKWNDPLGTSHPWTAMGTTTSNELVMVAVGATAKNPQIVVRVRAIGPGGASGWTQSGVLPSVGGGF